MGQTCCCFGCMRSTWLARSSLYDLFPYLSHTFSEFQLPRIPTARSTAAMAQVADNMIQIVYPYLVPCQHLYDIHCPKWKNCRRPHQPLSTIRFPLGPSRLNCRRRRLYLWTHGNGSTDLRSGTTGWLFYLTGNSAGGLGQLLQKAVPVECLGQSAWILDWNSVCHGHWGTLLKSLFT
jgi:hypothetical protein